MATTYLNFDNANDPATRTDIDTTVGSAPAERSATFAPPGTGATIAAPAYSSATTYGTGSQMASRVDTFDPAVTTLVTIDLGLAVNG